jgi:hexosaminidase
MLDVSRHWMPLEVVKRNLDAMAAVKLNVFHWHLSDDQGFRVESKRFPKLQELGSDGNFYTQSEIRQVVDYARDRGIRVIPEFDVPGHTTSWFVGYPELASAPGPYSIERTWGIFQPTLDPTREETYRFLDDLIGEMAALFPDPYFHIGGDEVDDTQWKNSAAIQKFARDHQFATSQALHAYFNRRVQEIVQKHGKVMIGWDEVLAPGLAANTVIQSWRGQEALAEASRKGYRGVLSFGYYLDHMNPTSFHYAVDPLGGAAGALDSGQAARVLGGEACMWVEYVSPETVDSRIWPRMAAIAERLWSPREVVDVNSMYARMEAVSRSLEWVGLQHRSNYEPMLERLGGGRSLRVLADASEATGIEIRRDARKYTSLVDLNRFPDAVRPESELIRHLELAAARLSPADLDELRAALREWADNGLSPNLEAVGAIGLRAMQYLEGHKPAPQGWISGRKQTLDAMEKPSAEVVLAAVRPVRKLLEALGRTALGQ